MSGLWLLSYGGKNENKEKLAVGDSLPTNDVVCNFSEFLIYCLMCSSVSEEVFLLKWAPASVKNAGCRRIYVGRLNCLLGLALLLGLLWVIVGLLVAYCKDSHLITSSSWTRRIVHFCRYHPPIIDVFSNYPSQQIHFSEFISYFYWMIAINYFKMQLRLCLNYWTSY